ncbi:MAG: nodulation protein NfeD [Thermoanaerobaculia bacterium]
MRSSFFTRGSSVSRLLAAFGLLLAGTLLWAADSEPDADAERVVVLVRVDSIIHPVAEEFIVDSLARADDLGAEAFVLELSTPGGLLTSTRNIFTAMLEAETPVVVFVSPRGSQAASAGFFLLMAADVAAMAPGTNTGAAHPVGGQGEEIEGPMGEKVENDAAATIRSLATRSGRNAELAEEAVLESRSFTADEALESGLVDILAANLQELLQELDGTEVSREGRDTVVLQTASARVERLEMSGFQKFLSTIAHPNIAYILMTLGGLGLYFELSNPGAVLPGVVGGICLILAFFALSVLPVNYAGVALIILAMIFFIAEVKVTSYGLLTVAGVISLILGSLMLFKSADPAIRVSLELIISMAVFTLVVVTFLVSMVIRSHRAQVATGAEGLLHKYGVTRTQVGRRGKVFVHGEIWNASADEEIPAGSPVEIVSVDGLKLRVRPETGQTLQSNGEGT